MQFRDGIEHSLIDLKVPQEQAQTSFSEQMIKDFPDLDISLITSVLKDAPTIASAIGALQLIREENHALQAARYNSLRSPREESSSTPQENDSLRAQLERSHAALQDLLEREYPRLDAKVVAVTLRDSGYHIEFTRRILASLSEF